MPGQGVVPKVRLVSGTGTLEPADRCCRRAAMWALRSARRAATPHTETASETRLWSKVTVDASSVDGRVAEYWGEADMSAVFAPVGADA